MYRVWTLTGVSVDTMAVLAIFSLFCHIYFSHYESYFIFR